MTKPDITDMRQRRARPTIRVIHDREHAGTPRPRRNARMARMSQDQPKQTGLVEWTALTIDCPEPAALAEFYAALLGGTITRSTPGGAFVDAAGQLLVFRAVSDYTPPTWPSPDVPMRFHFECVVEDPDTAAQELLPLGAKKAHHQDPDDPHLIVMLDPAGHPFCLIRSSAARRY